MWVAEHLALGSQVAVKLIDPELAKQQDARERFAREATAAAKLRSAHVVHILDHGIEGEQPFIIMELLEGEDLFDRLDRRKKLTLSETSKIITQVARALMRAHAEGIIHRDLKPENVFLSKNEDDELAKVLDFGVAKVTMPAKAAMVRTGVGTLIGTPHYMSPEQVKGLTEIDHRSDLWSLAIITYQCVTGQLPFDSEGVGDLLIRITMSKPVTPSELNAELPPAFDEWFKKACAKDPDERFETAREMADALAKVIGAPMAPVSQPGRVLVNLADSPDLDWGSLAGVRIPIPPRKSPSSPPAAEPSKTDAAKAEALKAEGAKADAVARSAMRRGSPPGREAPKKAPPRPGARSTTLSEGEVAEAQELATDDEPELVEVDEAGKSVPPAAAAKPEAARAAAPREPDTTPDDAPPPKSQRAAPAAEPPAPSSQRLSAPISANPFLDSAAPVSHRSPSSGRGLQTTVTGLASSPQATDVDFEIDNPRKRKATWMVAVAVAAAAIGITAAVINSRGGLAGLTGNAGPGGATSTAQSEAAPSTSARSGLGAPPPLVTFSGSASASGGAYDPTVTKKPTKPSATAPPRVIRRSDGEDDPVLVVPLPDREVPLPR